MPAPETPGQPNPMVPGLPQLPGLPDPQTPAELPEFKPAPLHPRLLTSAQYKASVGQLLGPEAAAVVTPPRDVPVNGLAAIGAAQVALSTNAVSDYETSALKAAEAALKVPARKTQLIGCTPTKFDDAACMKTVTERAAAIAFRRPVDAAEVGRWTNLGVQAATAYQSFDRGVELMLAGLLQSPAFLYLDESGVPDSADPTRQVLTAHQLASRLSYFLTNAPPDAELRAAADTGTISGLEVLKQHATRLLATAAAKDAVGHFFDEMLELENLGSIAKDPISFPNYNPQLAASMHESTKRLLTHLALGDVDFRTAFDTRLAFVDQRLAAHYGLPAVTDWTQTTLPTTEPRLGMLGQASFLTAQAHPSTTSPTYRGKFVRERLLCTQIAAPPPDVSTELPAPPMGQKQTMRQRLTIHMSEARCSGCHKMMDPLGFALEHFDAIGRYRTTDDGLPIDPSGELDGKPFADLSGLATLLKDEPKIASCLVRSMYRQGVGHVELRSEARPLAAATEAFSKGGHRVGGLLVALVTSDAFRFGTLEEVSP